MESFSKILQLSDLNDFINVSQDCIKPVNAQKISSTEKLKINHISLSKPSISIDDCLACKGCVTSADTVLLEHQRAEDFLRMINENSIAEHPKLVVMTISPQSLASIASKYNISITDATSKLEIFFRCRGIDIFLDTTLMREISLLESGKEFVKRYKENCNQLPVLSSSCPGWICYAEKVQGEYILPNISAIRSQLQIAGSFVKNFLIKKLNESPKNSILSLYHVSIMPCYDRKLEAIRKEFKLTEAENLVDQVLTTTELLYIFENPDLIELHKNKSGIKEMMMLEPYLWRYISRNNSESDGYLHYIATYAAKELFNCVQPTLKVSNIKNEDMQEIVVDVGPENKPLLFAKAYGFKNIQILLQNIKRKRKQYHYIEIMACPLGCLNGGGQIKLTENISDTYNMIYNTYNNTDNSDFCILDDQLKLIYDDWLKTDNDIIKNIYTSYSAASKTIMSITNKW